MGARRTSLTFHRIGLAFALMTTWFVVLLRIQPWPFSDYAVFLAVGQRLRAGDVLYSGIWDNKDPFVYYSIAALQGIGQPALWALEASWFVIASVSIYSIARTLSPKPLCVRWHCSRPTRPLQAVHAADCSGRACGARPASPFMEITAPDRHRRRRHCGRRPVDRHDPR